MPEGKILISWKHAGSRLSLQEDLGASRSLVCWYSEGGVCREKRLASHHGVARSEVR